VIARAQNPQVIANYKLAQAAWRREQKNNRHTLANFEAHPEVDRSLKEKKEIESPSKR